MPSERTTGGESEVPTDAGAFTARDGPTFRSRLEGVGTPGPERLIAAAQACCFSRALSNILARAGHPAHSIHTEATVTLRPVDGAPTITKIALVTMGQVPGLDELAFAEHALEAKIGSPVSRALAGVPEFTLQASLVP
jgi:osmotically inducible protein OsmC